MITLDKFQLVKMNGIPLGNALMPKNECFVSSLSSVMWYCAELSSAVLLSAAYGTLHTCTHTCTYTDTDMLPMTFDGNISCIRSESCVQHALVNVVHYREEWNFKNEHCWSSITFSTKIVGRTEEIVILWLRPKQEYRNVKWPGSGSSTN